MYDHLANVLNLFDNYVYLCTITKLSSFLINMSQMKQKQYSPTLLRSSSKRLKTQSSSIFSHKKLRIQSHLFNNLHLEPIIPTKLTLKSQSSHAKSKYQHMLKYTLPSTININHQFTKLSGLSSFTPKLLEDDTQKLVTAKKWVLFDMKNNVAIKGYKAKKQHDIASLSKVMTFYTSYMIISQYYLNLDKTELIVDEADECIQGTRIPLKQQNIVTLGDMLYAMLMSSANNAAMVIAKNLGSLVTKKKMGKYFSCFDVPNESKQQNINSFMEVMNYYLAELQLSSQTAINNPHGMCHNYSCALDIAKITSICFKIPLFKQILSTKKKIIKSKSVNQYGDVVERPILLENTNKLLWKDTGCIGGKTGCNNRGGESLVACYEGRVIVVVLGTIGREQKFMDTEKLIEWLRYRVDKQQI